MTATGPDAIAVVRPASSPDVTLTAPEHLATTLLFLYWHGPLRQQINSSIKVNPTGTVAAKIAHILETIRIALAVFQSVFHHVVIC